MRCLILGGAGFLGSHLANRLLREQNNIITVFDREMASFSNIKTVHNNLRMVTGNFGADYNFRELLENQEIVYHLVSTTVPSTSNIKLAEEIQDNVIPTIKLLEACVEQRVKKIVFLSSGGTVYGGGKTAPLKEEDEQMPICSYGIQKLTIERYIHLYFHLYGLDYRIVRLANPFGPFQNPRGKVGAVTTFLWKIMHDEDITIFGDGSVVRDYIYVDDAMDGITEIINQESDIKVFNLGSGKGYSLREIIGTAEEVLQKKASVKYEPKREMDVPYNVLDIQRYVEVTGKKPEVTLFEGMKKLAAFYKKMER